MMGLVLALALSPAAAAASFPPDRSEVMAVPPALQAQLRAGVVDPGGGQAQRLQRLLDFIASPAEGVAIQYREDATLTVAEAWHERQANCVTYTMLFLAFAGTVGLDAYPQEIEETLAWQQRDGIVYRTNHVNAGVRIGSRRYLVDVGGDFVMARHPAHRISTERLLAQYYNNRAATLMAEGQLPAALSYARVSLELDDRYPITWSNTGVLRLRDGDTAGAEHAYSKALALDPTNSAALFNLVSLYQRSGDRQRELAFKRRLDKIQERDPFHQFLLAAGYETRGQLKLAVKHYRLAISIHGKEPRFHDALARAYLALGDTARARRALLRAITLARDDAARSAYRSRLDALLVRR